MLIWSTSAIVVTVKTYDPTSRIGIIIVLPITVAFSSPILAVMPMAPSVVTVMFLETP